MAEEFAPTAAAPETALTDPIPQEINVAANLDFGEIMGLPPQSATLLAQPDVGNVRNNPTPLGGVVDMTRWLPRSDVSNTGLAFAAGEQPLVLAQLTGDGRGRSDRLQPFTTSSDGRIREVQIRATGDARKDAQQIQDAVNAAAKSGEQTAINVPPGTYRGNIIFPPGARNITLRAQEINGRRAVFDMSGEKTSDSKRAVFTLNNNRNIVIEGFEIANYQSSNRDAPPAGFLVTGASRDITIRSNNIHHLGLDTSGRPDRTGSQPIIVLGNGDSQTTAITKLNIANNHIHDLNLGQHEGIAINGNVDDFTVSINRLTNLNNIGIDVIGGEGTSKNPALDTARNGHIRGNFVSGIDTDRNPTYPRGDRSAGGIYVDGGHDIRIENNVVENTNRGIEVGCEHAGRRAEKVTVTNNWLRRNHEAAITVGAGERHHGATNIVSVANNIFQANGPDGKLGVVRQHHVTNFHESGNKFVDAFWQPK